jgi:putative membrane protein
MSADPSNPTLRSYEPYSGRPRGGGGGWRFWPLFPLAFLGAFLLLVVLAWELGASGRWGGPAPYFWPIFPLGFFLLFFAFFLTLRFAFWGRGWGGRAGHWGGPYSAEAVLRHRYARGEISEQEFRERLRVLRSSGP